MIRSRCRSYFVNLQWIQFILLLVTKLLLLQAPDAGTWTFSCSLHLLASPPSHPQLATTHEPMLIHWNMCCLSSLLELSYCKSGDAVLVQTSSVFAIRLLFVVCIFRNLCIAPITFAQYWDTANNIVGLEFFSNSEAAFLIFSYLQFGRTWQTVNRKVNRMKHWPVLCFLLWKIGPKYFHPI